MNRLTHSNPYNRTVGLCGAVAILITTSLLVSSCPAASPCLRPDDELWIVSTRHLGCPDGTPPDLRVRFLLPDSDWQSTDVSSLIDQATDDRLCLIYVHGNRLENNEVTQNVWNMYRCLTAGQNEAPPIRFIAWSWPSGKRGGVLRDVRAKAARTESDGYYLGWFLAQLPDDRPLSLVGYSFGARIVTGASHLLGGGRLSGRTLSDAVLNSESLPIESRPRVVLMAAASHSHWLRPGCYHERALSRMGGMLNIYNGSDRILRRYGTLDKSSRPDALGYTGMYTRDLGAEAERIEQFDASRIVGRDHSLANYQRDRWLRSRIQQFVFWLQPGEKSSESRTTKAANCRITAEGLARQSRQTHGASNRREPDHIEQGMSKAAG
jgi:hypothetical protein